MKCARWNLEQLRTTRKRKETDIYIEKRERERESGGGHGSKTNWIQSGPINHSSTLQARQSKAGLSFIFKNVSERNNDRFSQVIFADSDETSGQCYESFTDLYFSSL